jgi:hypothetical protein
MMFRKKRGMSAGRKLFLLAGFGALAMYFFDPNLGRTRRAKFSDQLAGLFRRGARRAERTGRHVAAEAYGAKQKLAHLGTPESPPPNDAALVAKVESEAFRRADFPKGSINVNAEDGIIFLRGELQDEKQISDLEQRVRKVTGVVDVRNLLHLPGQAPPNKK